VMAVFTIRVLMPHVVVEAFAAEDSPVRRSSSIGRRSHRSWRAGNFALGLCGPGWHREATSTRNTARRMVESGRCISPGSRTDAVAQDVGGFVYGCDGSQPGSVRVRAEGPDLVALGLRPKLADVSGS